MKGDILLLAEYKGDELSNSTYELLTKGREVADTRGTKLAVLLIGHKLEPLVQKLAGSVVDTVLVADHPALDGYNTELYCNVFSEVVKDFQPGLSLMGYTYMGMELGPAVAARRGATMVSNCVNLELAAAKIIVTRPMYGGTLHTRVEIAGETPCFISFQRGAFGREVGGSREVSVVPVKVEIDGSSLRSRVVDLIQSVSEGLDISKAEVIVAVGRGIKDAKNIPLVKGLAEALSGVLACSRPVADLGWLPPECHVGISGRSVAPKLYLACGISGASQHVAGMIDSGTVIAINSDPNAPIFGVADYGVVGDIFEIIPVLTEEAQKSGLSG
ncbi:electron transfer flavoprotein subunit alpha/FixB family protein [Chloroflexota bacterium]